MDGLRDGHPGSGLPFDGEFSPDFGSKIQYSAGLNRGQPLVSKNNRFKQKKLNAYIDRHLGFAPVGPQVIGNKGQFTAVGGLASQDRDAIKMDRAILEVKV